MDVVLLKQLREETGASIMACRQALVESDGDVKKAKKYLKTNATTVLEKKANREAKQGVIASYIHATNKVGGLVELHCETDFVARTEKFQNLARELALHITGMNPQSIQDLLSQPYVRDTSFTIKDLIARTVSEVGERIDVTRFVRYEI